MFAIKSGFSLILELAIVCGRGEALIRAGGIALGPDPKYGGTYTFVCPRPGPFLLLLE